MPKQSSPRSKNQATPPPLAVSWLERQTVTRLLYVACGLVLLAAGLLITTLYLQHHHQSVKVVQATKGFSAGTILSSGVVTVQLESVHYKNGNGVFSAPTGKKYAVVILRVTNRSDSPINVLPAADTYARDGIGNTIYLTPFTLESPFRAGELPAGETIRGELSYLVPTSGSLKLNIDAIWSGGVITYALR